MSLCLANITDFMQSNNGTLVISVFITLSVLGFSIFGAIYSNLVHNAQMSDGNAMQGSETARRYWTKLSSHLRKLAGSRAYSANFCYLSLLFAIVTLILYLVAAPKFTNDVLDVFCLITFVIAVVSLIVALVFASFPLGYKRVSSRGSKKCVSFLRRLLQLLRKVFWPVYTNVKRFPLDIPEE